jgi:hypothetical protein
LIPVVCFLALVVIAINGAASSSYSCSTFRCSPLLHNKYLCTYRQYWLSRKEHSPMSHNPSQIDRSVDDPWTIVSDHMHIPLLEPGPDPEPEFPINNYFGHIHFSSGINSSRLRLPCRFSMSVAHHRLRLLKTGTYSTTFVHFGAAVTQALIRTRSSSCRCTPTHPLLPKGLGVQLYAHCTQPRLPWRRATRGAKVAGLGT